MLRLIALFTVIVVVLSIGGPNPASAQQQPLSFPCCNQLADHLWCDPVFNQLPGTATPQFSKSGGALSILFDDFVTSSPGACCEQRTFSMDVVPCLTAAKPSAITCHIRGYALKRFDSAVGIDVIVNGQLQQFYSPLGHDRDPLEEDLFYEFKIPNAKPQSPLSICISVTAQRTYSTTEVIAGIDSIDITLEEN